MTTAFRWTRLEGLTWLPDEMTIASYCGVTGVSGDGSVISGYQSLSGASEPYCWSQASGLRRLDPLRRSIPTSFVSDLDASGTVSVGSSYTAEGQCRAVRWRQHAAPEVILFSGESAAYGVSADGLAVVGRAESSPGEFEAFRWTDAGGVDFLGDLPGGRHESCALAVSADGRVVVGYSDGENGRTPFRWTQERGMESLGMLAGMKDVQARSVSADGTIIVGDGFVWRELFGIQSLREYLMSIGLDQVGGWKNLIAVDVSNDGTRITGSGIDPRGELSAWLAIIPSESRCYADCDLSTGEGKLDIFDFLCFQRSFVEATSYACDCNVSTGVMTCDVFDFLCFQNAYVMGCQ